jgi:hypothetical protein
MARFVTQKDFEFIQHITRELIDETMDVGVILYKIVVGSTKVNIYGESTIKPRYTPVKVNAIVKYDKNTTVSEGDFGSNQEQQVEFRFAIPTLKLGISFGTIIVITKSTVLRKPN